MIRVQNIYYMLAYAFHILREQGYESCGTEEFENTADLLSAILAKGSHADKTWFGPYLYRRDGAVELFARQNRRYGIY